MAILCIWLAATFIKWLSSLDWTFESASRRAGRYGEEISPVDSGHVISSLLDIDRAVHAEGKTTSAPKK